jgi:hypothetical protein
LDLEHGVTRVDLPGGSMLRPMAVVTQGFEDSGAAPTRTSPPPPVQDRRHAYPVLRQERIDSGDLSVGGVTIEYTTFGLSGLTGIERPPTSADPKADLDANIGWQSKDVSQFAVICDDVPQAVLNAEDQLRALLEGEMRYRIDLQIDQHVLSGIAALAPPSGSTGTGLVAQTRNAVAAHRALGANPSVLLLNPSDAATLDLTADAGGFVFATRATGSASPLWDLVIRESEAVGDPVLIDPAIIGALHVATGTVTPDPYSKLERNLVRVRVEIEALFFGRDHRGAYLIT